MKLTLSLNMSFFEKALEELSSIHNFKSYLKKEELNSVDKWFEIKTKINEKNPNEVIAFAMPSDDLILIILRVKAEMTNGAKLA